ncbi:unnamed protein product [Blepharisma stoltei]|uniref:Uncharacterized protein n=1 Tax=Blepharisma stoltei TaxID=1481888 RepID=A0AAU9K080_9CILI|nr:unnamed protein product [Blepharisma stoltei]
MTTAASPAWSLTGRPRTEKSAEIPGPGTYVSSAELKEKAPSYSISKAERISSGKTATIVGPGAYNIPSSPKGRKAVFGSARRITVEITNKNPGPGNYEQKSKIQEGPQYSISGRKVQETKESPGPGNYDAKDTVLEKSPSYKFGTDKRNVEFDKNKPSPGPGTYEFNPEFTKMGYKFGNAKRVVLSRENVPGPGAYELPSDRDRRAYSLTSRSEAKPKNNSPGPGAYESVSGFEKRCYTVSRAKRFMSMTQTELPGPGAYDAFLYKTYQYTPGTRTGNRPSIHPIIDTPAPWAYNANKQESGPAFSIKQKYKIKSEAYPGPGAYEAKNSHKSQNPIIGTTQRFMLSDEEKLRRSLPGPGIYNPATRSAESPRWGFGSSKRSTRKESNLPGPGHYDFKSFIDEGPLGALNRTQ